MIALAIAAALQLGGGQFLSYLGESAEPRYWELKKSLMGNGRYPTDYGLCQISVEAQVSVLNLEDVLRVGKLVVTSPEFVKYNDPVHVLSPEEVEMVRGVIINRKSEALRYGTYCRR